MRGGISFLSWLRSFSTYKPIAVPEIATGTFTNYLIIPNVVDDVKLFIKSTCFSLRSQDFLFMQVLSRLGLQCDFLTVGASVVVLLESMAHVVQKTEAQF